jgi:hypothetical protein
LSLIGCGQAARVQTRAQQQAPADSASEDPAAQWADGYCGAVVQLVQALSTMPVVDPSSPRQASRTSSELLGSVIGGLDGTLAGLHGLGASPVAGGDKVRDDAITTFSGIRSRAAKARDRIDVASNDTSASRAALGGASAPLAEISKVNLLEGFDSLPALAAASKRAPNCEPLTSKDTPPILAPPR